MKNIGKEPRHLHHLASFQVHKNIIPTSNNEASKSIVDPSQTTGIGKRYREKKQTNTSNSSFPSILYTMVNTEARERPYLIRWIENGEAFVVEEKNPHLKEVLREYFNHSKYSSLQRQLNLYGFKKHITGRFKGAFHHPQFHYGSSETLDLITRCPPPIERKRKEENLEEKKMKTEQVFIKNKNVGDMKDPGIMHSSKSKEVRKTELFALNDVKPTTTANKKADATCRIGSTHSHHGSNKQKREIFFEKSVTNNKRCKITVDCNTHSTNKVTMSSTTQSVKVIQKVEKSRTNFDDFFHSSMVINTQKSSGIDTMKHEHKVITSTMKVKSKTTTYSDSNKLHTVVNKKGEQEVEVEGNVTPTPAMFNSIVIEEEDPYFLTPTLLNEEKCYDDDKISSFNSDDINYKPLPILNDWAPGAKDENEQFLDFFLSPSKPNRSNNVTTDDKCEEYYDELINGNSNIALKDYSFNLPSYYQEKSDNFARSNNSLNDICDQDDDQICTSTDKYNTTVNDNEIITQKASSTNESQFYPSTSTSIFTLIPTSLPPWPKYGTIQVSPLISAKKQLEFIE